MSLQGGGPDGCNLPLLNLKRGKNVQNGNLKQKPKRGRKE